MTDQDRQDRLHAISSDSASSTSDTSDELTKKHTREFEKVAEAEKRGPAHDAQVQNDRQHSRNERRIEKQEVELDRYRAELGAAGEKILRLTGEVAKFNERSVFERRLSKWGAFFATVGACIMGGLEKSTDGQFLFVSNSAWFGTGMVFILVSGLFQLMSLRR